MALDSAFVQVAVILMIAAAAGWIGAQLRQPLIVVYIIVGIIVGPSVLSIVTDSTHLGLFAEVGVAILLFLVGLKLDIHMIRSTGLVAVLTGLGQVIFTSVVGFGITILLGFDVIAALYIAVALTFSSTIIIVKLLSDKREMDDLHGRIAIGFLIVQDLVVILVIIALMAIGSAGERPLAAEIGRTMGAGLGFLLIVAMLARYVLPAVLERITKNQELALLFTVAWAVTLAAAGAGLGLSMEVGAFVAGVSLASTPYRENFAARMISLRDILILFFFIELGAAMTFDGAISQLVPAVVLSLFVLIGNPLIVLVIMGVMGYRKKVSFKAGLVVAQISEFSLILIALGRSLGQIPDTVQSLVTMVGVITITVSTYMILYSDQLYDRLAPALSIFERRRPDHDRDSTPDEPGRLDAIVVGSGRFGASLVEELVNRGARVLVVDHDPRALHRWRQQNVSALYGDVSEPNLLDAIPFHEANAVICTVPHLSTNLVLLDGLRRANFAGQIALTALDQNSADVLSEFPEVEVIRPFQHAVDRAVQVLHDPDRSNPES